MDGDADPGTTWRALFDRAAEYATTETAVRAALRQRREGRGGD